MILKQNCFIISKSELTCVLNGSYEHKQRSDSKHNLHPIHTDTGVEWHGFDNPNYTTDILERETTFIGSSLQRAARPEYVFQKEKKTKSDKEIEHSLSKKSKTKIVNKVTAWTRANKANNHKGLYNFITCTLTSSQIGTDKDFTKMKNVFFTYMRKYFNLNNYLYVLERQSKNTNNIHSHTIVDKWVPYERLNRVWCKILSDNGYTFPSHNYLTGVTEIVSVTEAMKRYDNSGVYMGSQTYLNPKTNRYVKPTRNVNKPNPVDVETIYNLQSVSKYVTKYITKNDSKIFTTVWNCSQSISRLWTGAIISAKEHYVSLKEQTDKIITLHLDKGYIMFVNLLKYYTKTQEKIFAINKQIIL
nr:hypothetical protein [Pedobacter sp. ASV2]